VGWSGESECYAKAGRRPAAALYPAAAMRVEHSDQPIDRLDADLLCVGLFSDGELPGHLAGAAGAADALAELHKLTIVRPADAPRALVVGLAETDELDPERARVAGALAVGEARRYAARRIAWSVPEGAGIAPALVEGTLLGSYRFDRFRTQRDEPPDGPAPELVVLAGPGEPEPGATTRALAAARAANRARELQDMPANIANPAHLVERARAIADEHPAIELDVLGPERLEREGLGGLLAVAAGSAQDPALIVLRQRGSGGPRLGLVGKGVTFDTGGISIKPSAGMHEMKMDMSGAAAVLEATAAVAELGLDIDLVTVVPAVENMPSGSATKPGDVITQLDGTTVEVNNTDAEGRLILADALSWAVDREEAERIVDVATLTGAVVVALGSTYAGLIANDDGWAAEVLAAGERSGELAWRLPLHPEYRRMIRGTVADLSNAGGKRKAGTIYAGAFLEHFVGDVPWAHLDIAGTAWGLDRTYVGKGASGFGTRLLVELISDLAGAGTPAPD
jgi:leucyl aminopeptidase